MGVDKAEIGKTILELEKSFNERWSVGDNHGYGDWRIAHSHWAFTQTAKTAIAS